MNHYCYVTDIFSTRFLNTKLNKVLYRLFVLKFKSVGLIKIKKITALVFRNKHLQTAMGTCEETVFSVTRCENRMQTALIFSFSGNYLSLYFLADWWLTFATQMLFRPVLRTEDKPSIVVIDMKAIFWKDKNSGIPFPRCWKISKTENSISFMITSMEQILSFVSNFCPTYLIYAFWFWASHTFTNNILLKIFPL